MKQLHFPSFSLGILSGIIMVGIGVIGLHGVHPSANTSAAGAGGSNGFGGGNGRNLTRAAQRFNMTEAELQKELDSGKTMQQITQEHGVTFGGNSGQGMRSNTSGGTTATAGTQSVSPAQ
ncbi:MAG: hypothetical protein JWM56_275 [Candidatus Peribacteria bacterium]|nr:hypothetical protein [Candidatus Peribacteria bacterium]